MNLLCRKLNIRKVRGIFLFILISFSFLFGTLIFNFTLNTGRSSDNTRSLVDLPKMEGIISASAGSYEGNGVTQINLTCIMNGTESADQNGFSIQTRHWNSTFLDLGISDVALHEFYYPIEENGGEGFGTGYSINTNLPWVMGFNISDSCRLNAVDFIYTTRYGLDTPVTGVMIYNATYNPLLGNVEPHRMIFYKNESGLQLDWLTSWISDSTASYWNGSLTLKPVLDIHNTQRNTFFIGFNSTSALNWYYIDDSGDAEGDQGIVYVRRSAGGGYWENDTIDFSLRLDVSPLIAQASPAQVNMTINSEPVSSSGTWNSSEFLIPNPSGQIPFEVTTTWYNISYEVNWTTYLQNITTAGISFYAQALNEVVLWNVTIPASFVTNSYNREINVTIPATWNATKVYNGSIEYLDWEELNSNSKKTVIIRNPTDATWRILCNGHNWVSNLVVYKDGESIQHLYTFDMVNVSADLIQAVDDNEENTAQLDILDPLQNVLDSIAGKGLGSFINITWDVAQSITTNGTYQLVISWFNGTEAGIWNTSVQIYNSTHLVIVSPEHWGPVIEMSKGQIFNLTLYYNMSYWKGSSWGSLYLNSTMGANVTYTYQGSAPTPMANVFLDEWAWTTEITSPNAYGVYPIYINATAWDGVQNYSNYLITLKVKQYGTKLIFNDTAKETFWNMPIAYSFTYTNLTDYSIETENITIQWKYDFDTAYRGTLQKGFNYSVTYNSGTEQYTIVFVNFSAHVYKLLFHIDADIYQSQDAYLTLIFQNTTTSLTNESSIPRQVYQAGGRVNVTVYYKDLVSNSGIFGGSIQSNWSSVKTYIVQELGGGYYNVSLDISGVLLNNYSILFSASKNNYEAASLFLHLEIYGYPTIIDSLTAPNLVGFYAIIYAIENWTVSFEYINTSNGIGIPGATIFAQIGGVNCVWKNINSGNYTVWVDTSKLPAPMAGQNYSLYINIKKALYGEQRLTITVNITKLPSQIYPIESTINAEIDDFTEMRVQLNDTHNIRGISGVVWYELQGKTQQMLPAETEGEYFVILNLTNYLPGEYQITLKSWAIDYQNTTTIVTLNVSRLNINIITESEIISSYVNELLNLRIQLKDSKERIITNHMVKYKINDTIEGNFIYDMNGFYNASIDLTGYIIKSYQVEINASRTIRFSGTISILTLNVNKIPTMIIPSDMNITAYYGEQYLLSAVYLDSIHTTFINAATLRYKIGLLGLIGMNWVGTGTYQATLNLSQIGIGNYNIEIDSISSSIYQSALISVELHILPKLSTQLLIYNPATIKETQIVNITLKLQTNTAIALQNKLIQYSIKINYVSGAPLIVEKNIYTNSSGMGLIQYQVPLGASLINVIMSFYGSSNLTSVWNSTNINIERLTYALAVSVQSHTKVGEKLRIQAILSNGTHPVGNVLLNFTIIAVLSGDVTITSYLAGITAENGSVVVQYTVPAGAITIYIIATYRDAYGGVSNSEPQLVISVDPWVLFIQQYGWLIGLIILVVVVAVIGSMTYVKVKRRFMSIEDKKRELVQKRADNRREIAMMEQEIKGMRSETLKEAEIASQNMNFNKAAKLYEKAGNLTLELADKSVAREFLLKAKEMQKRSDQKLQQNELKDQREKLLEKARSAIRERDVVEAARNYRQVAELSRMLGEQEQAEKFLKLADAANERVEALKEGDLRKESGIFLSKADKAMGKQDFLEAARNFEEASKIMLVLADDDGVERFAGWAKLARERGALTGDKPKDEWKQELIQKDELINRKIKQLIKERNFEETIKQYITLAINALELGNSDDLEKYKKNIVYYRKQSSMQEISPETRRLMTERKKLLLEVEDAIKGNRFAVVAKYYKRIAAISEVIDGKEVARSYNKQATYYLSRARERQIAEQPKVEEKEVPTKSIQPVARVAEDELEEVKANLAATVKNAREALKTGKTTLAKELYEKASQLAESVGDEGSAQRYQQKAEELEILKPKKTIENEGLVRKKIADLVQQAEKALQKKKFSEAKNTFEEISELFLQLGEEDAANTFLERANSLKRLII
ncbi:MAG TPA: hypothetical protein VMV49_08275 [Candidatus Deferrimicrobium sp.]|nr:hypothetical protein [Candidatus Deferrimicrobium sp.]